MLFVIFAKLKLLIAITKMPFKYPHQDLPVFSNTTKYIGKEDDFQKRVAFLLDLTHDCVFFHTPNGGKRFGKEGKKLQLMGVKAGVPDILILNQRKGYAGLAIELKVGRNGLQDSQINFLEKLHNLNYLTFVSYSLDEIISLIDWYFDKCKK